MANVLTVSPYKVDTVMPNSLMNTAGSLPYSPFHLREIYWLNPLAIGDTFTVTDGQGNVIKTGRCEVAGQSQVFQMYARGVSDIQVTQLSSGVLYIDWGTF
jgi:hypothetical protein